MFLIITKNINQFLYITDSYRGNAQRSSTFGYVQGQVKISMQYSRGQLQIIVQHARNLAQDDGGNPSPYVKLYLLPDPHKKTKRKTKIVKKSDCPTFMEEVIIIFINFEIYGESDPKEALVSKSKL